MLSTYVPTVAYITYIRYAVVQHGKHSTHDRRHNEESTMRLDSVYQSICASTKAHKGRHGICALMGEDPLRDSICASEVIVYNVWHGINPPNYLLVDTIRKLEVRC
jgi:hypothetical protein